MGLSLCQNIGTLEVCWQQTLLDFSLYLHMVHSHLFHTSPKILLFCRSSVFCARSAWEMWILLPTEPLPAPGSRICVAPASPTDCNRARQDCTRGPENKYPSLKPVICWTGKSICSRAPAGWEACPTYTMQGGHHRSSMEVVAALQLFSCHFKAEVLLYCDLLKSLRAFNPLLNS